VSLIKGIMNVAAVLVLAGSLTLAFALPNRIPPPTRGVPTPAALEEDRRMPLRVVILVGGCAIAGGLVALGLRQRQRRPLSSS
jgi:hypothetical protein